MSEREFMAGIVLGFMSPKHRAAHERREREYEQRLIKGASVPWDEDKTKFDKMLVLDGTTFQPRPLFDDLPLNVLNWHKDQRKVRLNTEKTFGYYNSLLPAGRRLDLWQGQKRGKVCFTTDVAIPTLVKWSIPDNHGVWMSLTPAEVLSARQGIKLAKGKCVVGGLGMGYFLEKILRKPSVTEVIVVEISKELLDWYGWALCVELAARYHKPIKVIHGDAFQELGQHGEGTRYLYDIWDSFPCYLTPAQEKIFEQPGYWAWGNIKEKETSRWR
jgi:hypothetical protein